MPFEKMMKGFGFGVLCFFFFGGRRVSHRLLSFSQAGPFKINEL
jgi:hypothetical protein